MRKSFWNKPIPTYAGLLLLVITALVTAVTIKSNTFVTTKASTTNIPENIHITNITGSSFTISFATHDSITSSITFGKTQALGNIALDERDTISGKVTPHQLHYFTITNLTPNTQYYFNILAGSNTFTNNGAAYTVTTGSVLEQDTNERDITGTAVLPDGTYPKEAIAYLQGNITQQLSIPLLPNGSFKFHIKSFMDQNLQHALQLQDNDQLQITINGDGLKSEIKVLMKDATQLPTITLSKQYDFITTTSFSTSSEEATIAAEPSQSILFPKFSINKALSKYPQILIPKKDQGFTDLQPEFSGTAIAYKNVNITLNTAKVIAKTVQADQYGNWSYRPASPLASGDYTITITTRDESGMVQTISQPFKIFAAGTQQFTEPSGQPTTTSVPTKQPTPTTKPTATPLLTTTTAPTATVIPTVPISPTSIPSTTQQPSPTLTPTLIPSPTPTQIVTPTKIVVNSPVPTNPKISSPGSESFILYMGIFAFATIIGAMLFFITQT